MDSGSASDDQEFPDYRDKNGEYTPVSLEGLAVGPTEDFDLFVRAGSDYFLVKPKKMRTSPEMIARYRGTHPYLYIRSSDRDPYYKMIQSGTSKIIRSVSVPIREKAAILTDCAVEIVDRLFSDPGDPATMSEAKHFTQDCVLFIGQQQHAFLHLVELSNHDHYTYAHSVGVAAYSIALAKVLGVYNPADLANIGLAGLLHDIGKCLIDPAIINKRGPLDEDEWAVMKKHPEYGADILKRHKSIAPVVIAAAESHHENLVGTGYPRRVRLSQLDQIVRIVSLADAFSALTTKRSYSPARDSANALMLMKENVDKKFDSNLFKKFVMLFLDPQQQKKAA